MAKLAPLAFGGAGAAAVCVGGAYIWKNGIGSSSQEGTTLLNANLGFRDLDGFKNNNRRGVY